MSIDPIEFLTECVGRYYILVDKKVVKVDLLTWGRWFENFKERVVAQTDIGCYHISTVFVGLENDLFETQVGDDYYRYDTWDEAEKGHNELVERYKMEAEYINHAHPKKFEI